MTFLITGASRGIGLELTTQVLAENHKVLACVRNKIKALNLKELAENNKNLRVLELDVNSDESAEALANQVTEPIDVLINNAGVYLESQMNNLRELSSKVVSETLQTNTLGPLRVTRALIRQLSESPAPKVVNITSLMGSIADNAGGGAYAYRMSKAALNMFAKCLAIEFPKFVVLNVHPGWVQTDMGGGGASVKVPESAKGILDLVLHSTKKESGKFFDYRKRELPW